MIAKTLKILNLKMSNELPFVMIGGPCAIESKSHALFVGEKTKEICDGLGIGYIFKASFDKASRTSIYGPRGIGLDEGLEVLAEVREKLEVPVQTDVHLPSQCEAVAQAVDIIQIPSFLCKHTDLLEAAAKTGKPVNVKKGQFMSPYEMDHVVTKLNHFGTEDVILTDRGSCFGYNALVVDFKGIPIMTKTGHPVIFDATHSVQTPASHGKFSGGDRDFSPFLARAAIGVGVAGIFLEVHDNPDRAPCDGANMLHIKSLKQLLVELMELDAVSKKFMRFV
ncbi:MAG: 3-deoxy-8-phosphooctulonate synthase [Holosporales bacterium]|jgi:2-dehydro-3-deoxyphosphooctonate aldolase (KDO 8-P synthase)|nr:3-deoxy-8-phosphooctulonate synthase [Holosporales bacterium]